MRKWVSVADVCPMCSQSILAFVPAFQVTPTPLYYSQPPPNQVGFVPNPGRMKKSALRRFVRLPREVESSQRTR